MATISTAAWCTVPIRLDGLVLETATPVAEAMADFSRLPYSDGQRAYNPDVANLSEEIVAPPFQNQNLVLRPGVHLHWALPDVLTRHQAVGEASGFPEVPDRWLVTRRRDGKVDEQWVVESDYLFPDGQGVETGGVCVPVVPDPANEKFRPFRYLGRSVPLASWPPGDEASADRLAPLTAVGYGEPAFAAFYPNCHSVFGFCDPSTKPGVAKIAAGKAGELRYEVLGWYSDPSRDFLRRFLAAQPKGTEPAAAMGDRLGWRLPAGAAPGGMLCYGVLVIEPPVSGADPSGEVTVAVGNTGTEALSAYLAAGEAGDAKLEDQLEALSLAPRLAGGQLDLGARFREARHERGFVGVPGGTLWTIVPAPAAGGSWGDAAGPAESPAAAPPAQPTLPESLARPLAELNRLQREFDQAGYRIEAMRRQLFSDWYKYMLSSYPPPDSPPVYPDIDEVRYFIEYHGIAPLEAAMVARGELTLERGWYGRVVTAVAAPAGPSLAARLAAQIQEVLAVLAAEGAGAQGAGATGSPKTGAPLVLTPVPAPRFWQPREPVVLLVGDGVEATPRHGPGDLSCALASPPPATAPPATAEAAESLLDNVATAFSEIDPGGKPEDPTPRGATTTWRGNPWHPFLLEWAVELFAYPGGDGGPVGNPGYPQDFIQDSFALEAAESAYPDLMPKAEPVAMATGIYTGSAILTPHATTQLAHELGAADPADLPTGLDLKAILERLDVLSQSLGGLNAALLMHKQTLQLAIDEPLGFPEYRTFTGSVAEAVAGEVRSAPQPEDAFQPIRAGRMEVAELRLVDTFGRGRDLDYEKVIAAKTLAASADDPKVAPPDDTAVRLPPRLAQPARLDLRWLSAAGGEEESTSHPASTPVCGWLVPNNLDGALMFYDGDGRALGSLDSEAGKAVWRHPPGGQLSESRLPATLARVVRTVQARQARKAGYLGRLLEALDGALDNIEPESTADDRALALLMGRPIAVVRVSLRLELRGPPATHQGWPYVTRAMMGGVRETFGFPEVRFPVRIGDGRQLDDGVVGFWLEGETVDPADEDETGFTGPFHAHLPPESNRETNEAAERTPDPQPADAAIDSNITIPIAASDQPLTLTLLIDPRGRVHAASGILPTAEIHLPADQYAAALRAIEVTFLTAPILTAPVLTGPASAEPAMPLPTEPGYAWSWLEQDRRGWRPASGFAPVTPKPTLTAPPMAREGYLRLSRKPDEGGGDKR